MTKDSRPLISLVCPVFNEIENVGVFYDEVLSAISDQDFDVEFIFVNDGSRDGTLAALRNMADKDSRVVVYNFSRNFGASAACACGLSHATGDAAILISVDLQDPPTLIPELVAKWRDENEIVWATRDTRDDPVSKKLFARLFYAIIRLFVFKDYPRDGTDVGLFSRRVIDVYKSLPERDSNPFFTLYSLGFQQARVPYHRQSRRAGESGWPFWRRVKAAIDIVTSFSYFPLRIISVSGMLIASASMIFGLNIIIRRVFFDLGGAGWPSLAVLILFLGGLQMLFIGIIAEYVWRISEQTRQRPRYIITERIGKGPRVLEGSPKLDPLDLDVSGTYPRD